MQMKIRDFPKNKKEILREFNKEKYSSYYNKYIKLTSKQKKNNLHAVDQFNISKNFKIEKLIKIKKIVLKYCSKYKKPKQTIVEFGCGYGSMGLFLLENKKFLSNKFIFLDIAKNGIKLLEKLAKDLKISKNKYSTGLVDIYNGRINKNVKIPKNSIFVTVGSMLYKKEHDNKFINFFLKYKFNKILFFEPIYEHNLNNKKICKYFIKNNYTQNLLKILQGNNKIEIIFEKKNLFHFKNKFLPYSLLVVKKKKH